MSSEQNLRTEQQEYYVPPSKWSQNKISQERYPSSDVALQNNQNPNKSAIIPRENNNYVIPRENNNFVLPRENNNMVMPRENNIGLNYGNVGNYQNPPVRTIPNNNSTIRMKNYQNNGNILEWQDNSTSATNQKRTTNVQERNTRIDNDYKNPSQIEPQNKYPAYFDVEDKNKERSFILQKENLERERNQQNYEMNKERNQQSFEQNKERTHQANLEQNNRGFRNIPRTIEKFESNVKPKQQVIPESREKLVNTSVQQYENTMNTIKNIEKNLMLAQIQKEKVFLEGFTIIVLVLVGA